MARPQPEVPGAGQESVWDYPRSPRLEPTSARLEVVLGGQVIASTTEGYRVLETSHPPTYYLPPELRARLGTAGRRFDRVRVEGPGGLCGPRRGRRRRPRAAWWYPEPTASFRSIGGYLAVMSALVDACFVDGGACRAPARRLLRRLDHRIGGRPFQGRAGTHGW